LKTGVYRSKSLPKLRDERNSARVCGPIIQVAERATRVKWTDFLFAPAVQFFGAPLAALPWWSTGSLVNGAFVLLRDIESPSQEFVSKNWQMQTESDGHFSFLVRAGCYDLFVSSNDSVPFSKRICVGAKNSVLEIKLQADRNRRVRIIDRF